MNSNINDTFPIETSRNNTKIYIVDREYQNHHRNRGKFYILYRIINLSKIIVIKLKNIDNMRFCMKHI